MSLEALVIAETAAGAHGLSFKKHYVLKKKKQTSIMNLLYPKTSKIPSRNTPSLLSYCDFYWLTCVIPALFTTPVYLLHYLAEPKLAHFQTLAFLRN